MAPTRNMAVLMRAHCDLRFATKGQLESLQHSDTGSCVTAVSSSGQTICQAVQTSSSRQGPPSRANSSINRRAPCYAHRHSMCHGLTATGSAQGSVRQLRDAGTLQARV